MSRQRHRARAALVGGAFVFLGGLAVAAGSATPAVAQSEERRSVWDGVYMDDQATRGKEQYEYNCAPCHIHDLSGDPISDVPALAGTDFMDEWGGKTVQQLLDYMSTNMPPDSRGSLGGRTYTDITAYVLRANLFPTGKQALGSNAAQLATTMIEPEPKK